MHPKIRFPRFLYIENQTLFRFEIAYIDVFKNKEADVLGTLWIRGSHTVVHDIISPKKVSFQ